MRQYPTGRGQGKTGWKSSNMWLATEGNSSVRDAASSLTESASYDSSGLAAVSAILGYQGQNITAQFDLM